MREFWEVDDRHLGRRVALFTVERHFSVRVGALRAVSSSVCTLLVRVELHTHVKP